jgi:hypothetical protein
VQNEPDRPAIERALRAAGLSARQAKKLLAIGWKGVVGERTAEHAELLARIAELELQYNAGVLPRSKRIGESPDESA